MFPLTESWMVSVKYPFGFAVDNGERDNWTCEPKVAETVKAVAPHRYLSAARHAGFEGKDRPSGIVIYTRSNSTRDATAYSFAVRTTARQSEYSPPIIGHKVRVGCTVLFSVPAVVDNNRCPGDVFGTRVVRPQVPSSRGQQWRTPVRGSVT